MGFLDQFLGRGLPLNQGMAQQQRMAQQFWLLGPAPQRFGPGPTSFENWICTPNTETYQEYLERRLPKEKD